MPTEALKEISLAVKARCVIHIDRNAFPSFPPATYQPQLLEICPANIQINKILHFLPVLKYRDLILFMCLCVCVYRERWGGERGNAI